MVVEVVVVEVVVVEVVVVEVVVVVDDVTPQFFPSFVRDRKP